MEQSFKNHHELPTKEFQFIIGKQRKTPTDRSEGERKVNNNSSYDRSEGDLKVNNNSLSDQTEGKNSRSINKNPSSQRDQVGASN